LPVQYLLDGIYGLLTPSYQLAARWLLSEHVQLSCYSEA
jgi:hypothetical protein